MPTKADEVKKIEKEINQVRSELRSSNRKLDRLTTQLEELQIYSSSSEEELEEIKVGDRVRALGGVNKSQQRQSRSGNRSKGLLDHHKGRLGHHPQRRKKE